MKIHILGICGTFMAGVASLAKDLGFKVSGSDLNAYPPMSTQLEKIGIKIISNYNIYNIKDKKIDLIIIGNIMSRNMDIIEYILNNNIPYMSGPEFLAKYILPNKHVLAVSGTHGKTTTTSILAWILEHAGYNPGYLIGGVSNNLAHSAFLGKGDYFVIEADEYDSAFFDKRSKFVHYKPNILIINNLEFDHSDIFDNISDIKKQFNYLLRTMAGKATIIYKKNDENLQDVFEIGCWSKRESFNLEKADWDLERVGEINWELTGDYNYNNALAAIAAAYNIGIPIEESKRALQQFTGVKRRMELLVDCKHLNVKIYDDFAHHPTAIKNAIYNMRQNIMKDIHRLIAIIDLGTNTMARGTHKDQLILAIKDVDQVYFYISKPLTWDVDKLLIEANLKNKIDIKIYQDINLLYKNLLHNLTKDTVVLLMGNSSFGGVKEKLRECIINA